MGSYHQHADRSLTWLVSHDAVLCLKYTIGDSLAQTNVSGAAVFEHCTLPALTVPLGSEIAKLQSALSL